MTIYLDQDVPAVCKNPACTNYRTWETVTVEDILEDDKGNGYVICEYCQERIPVQ